MLVENLRLSRPCVKSDSAQPQRGLKAVSVCQRPDVCPFRPVRVLSRRGSSRRPAEADGERETETETRTRGAARGSTKLCPRQMTMPARGLLGLRASAACWPGAKGDHAEQHLLSQAACDLVH
ncbi:unnamed protein product [Protopolystoma xenopodis]|uniref:Uncharacterized protein n=1 Tax=Protopolystoma xenopodis TaxID=117903 RepID=A0A3S5C967_9PLAT|nr:unnamed protein product [Protopolystoma xenopodis]